MAAIHIRSAVNNKTPSKTKTCQVMFHEDIAAVMTTRLGHETKVPTLPNSLTRL